MSKTNRVESEVTQKNEKNYSEDVWESHKEKNHIFT